MDFPYFEVEFTKQGAVFQQSQLDAVQHALGAVTDLFIISHGWNNDIADARNLYERFFQTVSEVLATGLVPGVNTRSFAVVGVFWPSKKFTDEELIPGGGAASANPQNMAAVLKLLEELKNDPLRLGHQAIDAVRAEKLDRAKDLVPKLEADENARREFVHILRSIVNPAVTHADDGSDGFFAADPLTLFQDLSGPVVAPAPTGGGGAAGVGGGAAGLSDLFGGVIGAARRLANFTTYSQMKERAGTVGGLGLAQLIGTIRQGRPDLRIHLIGHSFGGRVVTAAAKALDPNTPRVSLTLLQTAFSHNGLSEKFDGQNDGFFRTVVSEKRVAGPILITHTKNDKAVGIAYPLASRVAHDKAAALGDADDPYGGLGRNGAQKTREVAPTPARLLDLGEFETAPYSFQVGAIYNLNSDRFILDHNHVSTHEVACALLAAVATT